MYHHYFTEKTSKIERLSYLTCVELNATAGSDRRSAPAGFKPIAWEKEFTCYSGYTLCKNIEPFCLLVTCQCILFGKVLDIFTNTVRIE